MISKQDFEQSETERKLAETTITQAGARLKLVRRRAGYTVLAAPYDCGVTGIHAQEGEFVNTGSPIVSICSLDPLVVEVGIPDSEIMRINKQDRASVSLSSLPKTEIPGVVTSIGALAEATTRTFPIEITIANPQKKIKPGMVASVELTLGTATEVVTIPLIAVVKDERGHPVAYVVDRKTDCAEPRRLTLGRAFAREIEVVSGLTAGEEIVVQGQHYLEAGQKIQRIKKRAPAS